MGVFGNLTVGTIHKTGDKASSAGPNVLDRDALGNALLVSGTSVPADGGSGYAVGCEYLKTDAAASIGEPCRFVNLGTTTSCAFRVLGPVAGWSMAEGFVGYSCTNGQTALPAPVVPGLLTSSPILMQFHTTDDQDTVVAAAGSNGGVITPELSADPLTAHAVNIAVLKQNVMPGWVCTHAGTATTTADATGIATNDITVTGAGVGDLAFATFKVTDDSDQVCGASISAADTLTLSFSANPGTTHTVAYAVFAPVAKAVPAYHVAYAGVATTAGSAAAEAITVTGALTTDIAIARVHTKGSTPRTIVSTTVSAADTLTVTFSGDPSSDHKVSYMLLRAC